MTVDLLPTMFVAQEQQEDSRSALERQVNRLQAHVEDLGRQNKGLLALLRTQQDALELAHRRIRELEIEIQHLPRTSTP